MLMMAMVFVVGAGAGLAGAKWFASAPKNPPLPVPSIASSAPVATAVDPDGQARALRGIRPSELPYDGRAPVQDEESVREEQKAASAQPQAPQETKQAAEQEAQDTSPPPAPASQEPKTAAASEQKQIRDTDREPEAEAAPPPPRQAKRAETPARKVVQTAKSGKGREDNREVERMRRQADEELNKKTVSATQTAPRRSTEPSRVQQVSAALASCDRRSNIILREHCRWQICNGMWGKNGCPSYASARRDPYAY